MNIKNIAKHVGEELDIDPSLVEKVGRAQFKMVKETITEGKWECVYLQNLGKFGVKPSRKKSVEAYERSKQE